MYVTAAFTGLRMGELRWRDVDLSPLVIRVRARSGRLEVGGDLHDLVVGPAEARSLIGGT